MTLLEVSLIIEPTKTRKFTVELRKLYNLCSLFSPATAMIQLQPACETSLEMPMTTKVAATTTSYVSPWLAPLIYALGHYLVLPLFFRRLEVVGQENLPTTGPVILAPTHRAWWDSILVAYTTGRLVTGRDPRFMVSVNEANKGIQGWLIRRLGGFPIDPVRPAIAPLRHGLELLQQGEVLVIFPEGNYFRDGYVHPLKPGLARLALSAETSAPGLGIKVVPIGIRYSQAFPRWGCNVKVCIGSPLEVSDYRTGSIKQNAKQLTGDLEMALKQLTGQERQQGEKEEKGTNCKEF